MPGVGIIFVDFQPATLALSVRTLGEETVEKGEEMV